MSVRTVDVTVFSTGTLQAPDQVTITAESAGRVEQLRFTEGDQVEKGDVLLTLERQQEAATVRRREATLRNARRDLQRLEQLEGETFVSESDLDAARTTVSEAQAALAIAEDQLADRTIEAPFAGMLGERMVSVGALLSVGDAVVSLTRTAPLDLVVDVPEQHLPALTLGMTVRASTRSLPERAFDGEVTFVDSEVDAATRTVRLEATLPNETGKLRPGQFMRAEVVLERREALTVPEAAVLTRGPVTYLYALTEGAVAKRRTVETGLRRDGWVEITDGLEPGDRVITAGLQRVRSGSPVRLPEENGGGGNAEAARR